MRTQHVGAQQLIVVFLGILVIIMLGGVLYLASSIILPFMVALFLAYLLDPLVRLLTYYRIPLALAVCFALLVTFVCLALMGMLFYASAQSFVKEYPTYEPKLRALLATLTARLEVAPLSLHLSDLSKEFSSASVVRALLASAGTFVTFLGHLLLVLLFMVFILLGQRRLPQRIHRAFGAEQAERLTLVLHRITRQVQTYLGTKALLSLVTGVLVNLALMLLQIDFAVLWGALAFMLNFIPHVGALLATIPPLLLAILKFDTLMPAFWLVLWVTVIHIVLGMCIEPRLMGRSLHLSPLLVVLALLFWGWLWGIVGTILAVPIMATLKIVCENLPSLHFLSALMSEE
ncbi:MAG: AI-2E family transporter [Candidatus Tectomicrobia bacterium]|uniref:AI-2E family transporter n=1 Tax=Tectimicrobiota bacterium TaxID=2528274 RepID=A0A937W3D7_UNCTE|nr:AI-2E family transporter [Candidatus Tectomicrobia bacterium]